MIEDQGIRATLRARVASPPEIRYTSEGQELVQCYLTPICSESEPGERLLLRFGGRDIATLARWLQVGRQIATEGRLVLRRWTTKTGEPRALLLLMGTAIHPLDERDDRMRAMTSRDVVTTAARPQASTVADTTDRVAKLRELLELQT